MWKPCVLVLAVLALAPPHAEADNALVIRPPPANAADAKLSMESYFAGEKKGGFLLMGMGMGGLAAGGLLYRHGSQHSKGMSYPFFGVGVLHIAAGIFVYVASDSRIDTFRDEIDRDGQAWVLRERDRMAGVSTQFTILKIVEVGLIAGGLTMAGVAWRKDMPRLQGVGIAIAIEAAITLGFDFWAASRAKDYRGELAGLEISSGPTPLTDVPTTLLAHTFHF
jgi:hypothetical protein